MAAGKCSAVRPANSVGFGWQLSWRGILPRPVGGRDMKLTTPKPPIDLLDVLPELADLRATTVRLHPRKGRVPGRNASKMGGVFLWPSDEPWPTCDERWPPSWYGPPIAVPE